VLALALTAPAWGQESSVKVDGVPVLTGTLRVGSLIEATGGHWSGPSGTTARWVWLRCPDNTPNTTVGRSDESQYSDCTVLETANTRYTLTGDDLDKYMRLGIYASNNSRRNFQYDFLATPPSTKVLAAAPAATPVPTPTPTPEPAPTPVPTFEVPQPAPTPVPTNGQVLHNTATQRKALKPFPVVRMKGTLTVTGARVTLLSVRAPKRAKITVRCSGFCPAHRWARISRKSRLMHLAPFQRALIAGTKLTITVTRKGYVGKRTTFLIRRGKAPLRADQCVSASGRKTKCPVGV